jgi:hypothetical protein
MLTTDVIAHFGGSEAEVARALKLGRAAVNKWKKLVLVPPLRAAQLQKMTRGKLKFDPDHYADWYSKRHTSAGPPAD